MMSATHITVLVLLTPLALAVLALALAHAYSIVREARDSCDCPHCRGERAVTGK